MHVVTFFVLDGDDKGRAFRDLPVPVTIGREEGNALRLNDFRTSRHHAEVQFKDGDFILTDLDSVSGTRVNGSVVESCRLRAGDRVSIGGCELLFGTPAEIARRRTLVAAPGDPLPDGLPSPGSDRIRTSSGPVAINGLYASCEEFRAALLTGSVICTNAPPSLTSSVLDPESAALKVLGQGFHRVVVINASTLSGSVRFVQERFLTLVRQAVETAFNLQFVQGQFHAEDIFQILRDEPASLFCFAHFENVPRECFPLARAFAQSQHRALFLNEGPRNIHVEERDRQEPDSGIRDAIQVLQRNGPSAWSVSDEDLPPLPQRLSPAHAVLVSDLFITLASVLQAVVANIPVSEDCTSVVLGVAEWQSIQAVQFALARCGREVAGS